MKTQKTIEKRNLPDKMPQLIEYLLVILAFRDRLLPVFETLSIQTIWITNKKLLIISNYWRTLLSFLLKHKDQQRFVKNRLALWWGFDKWLFDGSILFEDFKFLFIIFHSNPIFIYEFPVHFNFYFSTFSLHILY